MNWQHSHSEGVVFHLAVAILHSETVVLNPSAGQLDADGEQRPLRRLQMEVFDALDAHITAHSQGISTPKSKYGVWLGP
jgi:hypothetical protein